MSVFTSFSCQLVGDSIVNHIAWSHSNQILALSLYTVDDNDREINQVLFSNSEGEIVSQSSISHDYDASVFEWHPTENVLAIGWGDGMVSAWSVDTNTRPSSLCSNNSQHVSAITVLKWNPVGKRLVTGDKKGTICVWAVDSRGSLSPIRQYKKKGEVTCLIFCPMPIRPTDVGMTSVKADAKQHTFSPSFFFGTDRGAVVYADDLGHCTDVQQLSSSIDSMMFFEEKSCLIIITRSLLLTQYHVTEDGRVTRVMQVKLSVPCDTNEKGLKSVIWAGPGLIAAATEEKIVRLLDLAADESYNISLNSALGDLVSRSDKVCCVSFSPIDRYLAVGTQMGLVLIWKFCGVPRDISGSRILVTATSASDWQLIFKFPLTAPIVQLSWYGGRGMLAATTEDGTVIFHESVMHSTMCGDLFVMQTSSTDVAIMASDSIEPVLINTGLQIRGLAVGKSCFVVWNGKAAKVFKTDQNMQHFTAIDSPSMSGGAMAIADSSFIVDDAWFVVDNNVVKINNFTGTQKGIINFSETEGMPEFIDINTKFLAVLTCKGLIKIFDVHTPTKPKQLGSSGSFGGDLSHLTSTLKVRSIKVNCSGSRLIVLADNVEGTMQLCHPDPRIFLYDRSRGSMQTFSFASHERIPVSVFWDDSDDRLFACEAVKNRTGTKIDGDDNNSSLSGQFSQRRSTAESEGKNAVISDVDMVEVFIFFATSEHGILMQDSFPRKQPYGSMVGLSVPRLYFRNSSNYDTAGAAELDACKLYSKVMRDFIGIDVVNDSTKKALLNFSFNLTLGKLDEAYKAVKSIDSPSIWENMAQMCVKTKRLDVAEVCLGNMGHARGAAALRNSRKGGSADVSVGILAIQLGLLDDAAKLFREVQRYDMLNKLYQSAGLWDKAIQTATVHDRIHLKTTHYQFAKHLESIGRIDEAIEHFQLSENSRTEVPRMLFHLGRVDDLGEYVLRSDDAVLLRWWAAYLESIERYDKAKKIYSKAKDYLSLVRISCFKGDFNKAAEIVSDTGDRASSYHFARQLENQGEYQEAINFYASSGCYNHSIRLARAFNLDSELMRFALKSTPSLMIECGAHFEERGEFDKAVQLYHKGGDIPRALDLCFRATSIQPNSHSLILFDMLNTIAQDLGDESSPQTLARCAEFLVQHKQYEKAVELYVKARRYKSAVEMCLQHKVNISDDMVDRLTPPESVDKAERKEVLLDLAKALKKQGSFLTAYKKYTQAGDRLHAVKCLVRSGNTKAVIEFASISRSPEIYKIAANYLQQMNWRENVDIMKAIILFYTKAKAFIQLAGFYDSCAQVEIDEYRDYDKAIGALKEAIKYLKKDDTSQSEIMSEAVQKRIYLIEQFIQAKKVSKTDPSAMVIICENLLCEPALDEAVRAGDCLALLVEYFHFSGDSEKALKYLKDMENRRIQLHPFLDNDIIDQICQNSRQRVFSPSEDSKFDVSHSNKRNLVEDTAHDNSMEEDISEELEDEEVLVNAVKSSAKNHIRRK